MRTKIAPIEDDNLSDAWAKAFIAAMESPRGSLSRLVVTVRIPPNGVAAESTSIRGRLSDFLAERRESSIDTISSTIFPNSLWNPGRPAQELFERYERIWPRVKLCPANRNGVYFQRLIAFGDEKKPFNQLEHVLRTWRDYGNHRHSALQAAIFDPSKDHVNSRQRGFPCLQQLAFDAQGTNGSDGLIVTGFYATQTLLEKAYGNYLGLARLGQFMAHELQIPLKEVTCIANVAKHAAKGRIRELQPLTSYLRSQLG